MPSWNFRIGASSLARDKANVCLLKLKQDEIRDHQVGRRGS
jgi:hypothetical protein